MATKKDKNVSKQARKLFNYSEENLKLALQAVREDKMSTRTAAKYFNIPRSTLQDRVSGKTPDELRKTGPEPIMTVEGEKRIKDWLLGLAKCGFPIKKHELIQTVTKIATDNGRIEKFKNNRPGEKWYTCFIKRHPEIGLRESESINKARAVVTEQYIRSWFSELENFLLENNIMDVMEDPLRIFNGDESGFSLCPKTGKVLAPRGYKNVYSIKQGNEKETLTVLVTFNASGNICPPLVVFPYVRPPKAVINNMPENWVLGKSDSGWMKSDVFYEYVCNDFNQWLKDNNIKRPIIFFIDGHRSHLNIFLSEFCEKNGIILYALPPNTTHILQPADVSVFRSLKHEWKKTVRLWQSEQDVNTCVTKINFSQILQRALNKTDLETCIRNGFRKCGLFPLNSNNVDYTKCVKNELERKHDNTEHVENISYAEAESAKKVIRVLERKLKNSGIDTNIIYEAINDITLNANSDAGNNGNVRQEQKIHVISDITINRQDNLNIFPLEVGTVLPMDSLDIIPVEEINLFTLDNVSMNQVLEEPQQNEVPNTNGYDEFGIETINADCERYCTIEEANNVEQNTKKENLKTEQEEDTNKTEDKENIDPNITEKIEVIRDNLEQATEQEAEDSKNQGTNLKKKEKEERSEESNKFELEEEIKNIHKSPLKLGQSENNDLTTKWSKEKTPIKTMETEEVLSPFSRHLRFPEPIKKASENRKKEKLPSAISSTAWRKHIEKQEQEKINKQEAQQKRKEERLEKQSTKMRTKIKVVRKKM